MAELLRMPEVAAGVESVILSTWSVAENTPFSAGDVIAVLETDKAVVDVEAETDGVILRRLVADGTDVPVGDPIALIAASDETVDIDATLAALGYGATTPTAADSPSPAATDAEPSSGPPAVTVGAPDVDVPTGSAHHGRLFASPLARRMARQADLAIASITGTGPGGRIVRRDVENALAAGTSAPEPSIALTTPVSASTSLPVAATTPVRTPSESSAAAFTDTPHTRLRRAIAARLTESKQTAPHFYLRGTARVDRLLALREELNSGETTRISVNDLIIKAVAKAHATLPALNVIWTPDSIRRFETVDICVAIATDNGLVTPVLRSVEQMAITTIAATVKDYAQRAKAGRLQQSELEGGVISVTNLGMLGTEEFSAIINPPQSAILAVGAARQEPVVTDGALAVGSVMRVTLSVDHRPVDGVIAAQWMQLLITLLENPAKILA
jgi:pyruvate dehydrogenase E2 component (dihydrolipoamide acetyltransferase)